MTSLPFDQQLSVEQMSAEQLTAVLKSGLRRFLGLGAVLHRILEERLYEGKASFEAYLSECCGMSRSQAYRLIDASKVMANLEGASELPVNEAQCRPLARLTPEQQRQAWTQVLAEAGDRRATAALVEATVRRLEEMEPASPTASTQHPEVEGAPLPDSKTVSGEFDEQVYELGCSLNRPTAVSNWRQPDGSPIDPEVAEQLKQQGLLSDRVRQHTAGASQSTIPPEYNGDKASFWRNRAITAEKRKLRLEQEVQELRAENGELRRELIKLKFRGQNNRARLNCSPFEETSSLG